MEFIHTALFNTQPTVNTAIQGMIAAHIESHQTRGVDWPGWAEWAIVLVHVRYLSLCAESKHTEVLFFKSKLDMDRKLAALKDVVEPGKFRYEGRIQEWEWGPQERGSFCFG